jgi:hypothetical protein
MVALFLGREAVAAAMFADDFFVPEIGGDEGAVAVAVAEFFGRSGAAIAADKLDGDEAAGAIHALHFVVVEIEEGLVRVDHGDVHEAVAIIIHDGEAAAVSDVIEPGERGDVLEGFAAAVGEIVIALVAAEGMDKEFAVAIFPGNSGARVPHQSARPCARDYFRDPRLRRIPSGQ